MVNVTVRERSPLGIWIAVFALIGSFLGSWMGPKAISWYATPAVPNAFNCEPSVTWAMERLLWTQGICTLAGAVLGAVFVFIRRRSGSSDAV